MVEAGLGLLVPHVNAWASPVVGSADEASFGWFVYEWRQGAGLDAEFLSLTLQNKELVLRDITAILAAMQVASLPEGVDKVGGLTFDATGQIVSRESSCKEGRPSRHMRNGEMHDYIRVLKKWGVIDTCKGGMLMALLRDCRSSSTAVVSKESWC